MELAITIWVIGWLFACGIHHEACIATNQNQFWYWFGYIILLVAWPHYLGSAWADK